VKDKIKKEPVVVKKVEVKQPAIKKEEIKVEESISNIKDEKKIISEIEKIAGYKYDSKNSTRETIIFLNSEGKIVNRVARKNLDKVYKYFAGRK
jgi:hypothetical protein